ncbi:MAG: phosphotransferase, partial [Paludibacteraceae bacterium]|nr:phosphotransferase [Paludibacteraceae bacterium]
MDTEQLSELFIKHFKTEATSVIKLKGAGSNRQYFRLSNDDVTAIGVHGESAEENKSFIMLAKHFASQGLPTPTVFCHTDDYMFYLQEDLGDTALFDAMANGVKTSSFSDDEKALLFKTIEKLPDMQFKGAEGLDFSVCYPQSDFDHDTVMWDLNYFKYCYLKATGIQFLETKLEDDFRKLADDLLAENTNTFLYRDFQSRNVMIKNGDPYFI